MNRLKAHKCYLMGPMDRNEDRGEGWRADLTPFLHSINVGVLSPTNKATFLGHEDVDHIEQRQMIIQAIKDTTDPEYQDELYDLYHNIMKNVVATDLRMVDLSDFTILHVDYDIYACGTYHENCTAVFQRKPVIVMCQQGKVNVPPWLHGVCKHKMFFDSWDDVKEYIRHINEDEKVETLNRWRFYDYDKVFGR